MSGLGIMTTKQAGRQLHAGDMPNIYAHADGTARADVLNSLVTLQEGVAGSVFDGDG